MTVFGIDISENQAGLSIASVKHLGYQFVTARALSFPNGLMQPDPSYPGFRDACRAHGLLFAWYVLVHTWVTPAETARLLAQVVDDPTIPGMIDLEPDADTPTLEFAAEFYDACASEGLRARTLYDPRWYWTEQADPPLTIRRWALVSSDYGNNAPGTALRSYTARGGDSGPGWGIYGGMLPTIWQFGSQIVLGVDQAGATVYGDADATRHTPANLVDAGLFTDWQPPGPPAQIGDARMYLVTVESNSKTVTDPAAPANTSWPGIFLYSGAPGQLTWVPTLTDRDAWLGAGLELATVGWEQWLRICPGNQYEH